MAAPTAQAEATLTAEVVRVDPVLQVMTARAASRDGLVLTGAQAKDWTISWNGSTRVEGGPLREGEIIHFKAEDGEGTRLAIWIHVGRIPAAHNVR